MKLLVSILAFSFSSLLLAETYEPPQEALLKNKINLFLSRSLAVIESDAPSSKKEGLLNIIFDDKTTLYNPQEFSSELLVLKKRYCTDKDSQYLVCGRLNQLYLRIKKSDSTEHLEILYKGKTHSFSLLRRTQLRKSISSFGRAFHIIQNTKNTSGVFIILGSREYSENRKGPLVARYLNLLKLSTDKLCPLAESNILKDNSIYKLLVEYARALGSKAHCSSKPVVL